MFVYIYFAFSIFFATNSILSFYSAFMSRNHSCSPCLLGAGGLKPRAAELEGHHHLCAGHPLRHPHGRHGRQLDDPA